MSFKPYPIVPFNAGLEKDKQPFILQDDAFPVLNNCYQYLGSIYKKGGNKVIGRLVQLSYQKAMGNTGTSPFTVASIWGVAPAITGVLGIQPGSVSINIAAPIGSLTYTDDGSGNLSAPGPYTGTINYTTGALSINHPAGAASAVTATFSYYTGRSVMGLRSWETTTINKEKLIAFDTAKSNLWNTGTSRFDDISYDNAGAEILWSNTDSDFFWTTNYYKDTSGNKLFWATNNKANSTSGGGLSQDGIRIYNGTAAVPGASGGWYLQTPQLNSLAANRFLVGSLILVPYRDRMVALNTLESTLAVGGTVTRYSNRVRWSQNGVPYTNTLGGADTTAWYDTVAGKGGYIDAPTSEQIVSCGFYKDILIVFFERSTWQLLYTGNEVLPFVWQKINTNFGAESTFSTIEFDKGVMGIGDKAIIASDSVNVERIDDKIPEEVFHFHNQNDGPKRVYGIRDYFFQFSYWTFPSADRNGTYPDKLLVLNYQEGSYSLYDDTITCFGYYQDISDRTWATSIFPWQEAVGTWSSARKQADFPSIAGGNQQGFVFIIDQQVESQPTLYITSITQATQAVVTSPSHNLKVGQYVKFSSVEGMTQINSKIGKIVAVPSTDTFTVDIDSSGYTAYAQAGLIAVLFNFEIQTKKFNPFFIESKRVRSNYFDMYFNRTTNGQISLDVLVDDSKDDPISTYTISTDYEYGPTIPMGKLWERIYCDASGQFLQFKMYLNDTQMRDENINSSPFVLHAINAWMGPSGNLFSMV